MFLCALSKKPGTEGVKGHPVYPNLPGVTWNSYHTLPWFCSLVSPFVHLVGVSWTQRLLLDGYPSLEYPPELLWSSFQGTGGLEDFVSLLWWDIGDNAYAPQPRYMRLCWKHHTTSTSDHHKPHIPDLHLCWKIHQHVKPPPIHPINLCCAGNSTPPARQPPPTHPIDLRLCWKIHITSTSNYYQHTQSTFVCVGKFTSPACQTTTNASASRSFLG